MLFSRASCARTFVLLKGRYRAAKLRLIFNYDTSTSIILFDTILRTKTRFDCYTPLQNGNLSNANAPKQETLSNEATATDVLHQLDPTNARKI
jgi:hypothetical protein